MVPSKWHHLLETPGVLEHPCPFKAVRDGFCARHHPRLAPKFRATTARLIQRQALLEKQLERIRLELAERANIEQGPAVDSPS